MAFYNPIAQPIRFRESTKSPDYSDRWPNIYNVDYHREWQKGVIPPSVFRDHVLNREIKLQFRFDNIVNQNIKIYKWSVDNGVYELYSAVGATDVTPTGWLTTPVYNYSFTPQEIGTYYFDFEEAEYISDPFIVHSSEKFLRRMFELTYSNYENDYSLVYFKDGLLTFEGRVYFTGNILPSAPGNDISVLDADRGNVTKLRSTPVNVETLNIADVHYSEVKRINFILSNSVLTLNGITYQTKDAPSAERIEGSTLYNMTVDIYETNDDYSTK